MIDGVNANFGSNGSNLEEITEDNRYTERRQWEDFKLNQALDMEEMIREYTER